MVIHVLDHLVDGVFEVIDDCVVISNDISICLDRFLYEPLTDSEVLHHETKTRID